MDECADKSNVFEFSESFSHSEIGDNKSNFPGTNLINDARKYHNKSLSKIEIENRTLLDPKNINGCNEFIEVKVKNFVYSNQRKFGRYTNNFHESREERSSIDGPNAIEKTIPIMMQNKGSFKTKHEKHIKNSLYQNSITDKLSKKEIHNRYLKESYKQNGNKYDQRVDMEANKTNFNYSNKQHFSRNYVDHTSKSEFSDLTLDPDKNIEVYNSRIINGNFFNQKNKSKMHYQKPFSPKNKVKPHNFYKNRNIKIKSEIEEMNQRESLIWQLNHNKYECMICVTNIRAEAPTWSCENCYHIFHIGCIKKWAATCGNSVDKDGSKMNLRCPACQKEYNIKGGIATESGKEWLLYLCFCGKQVNPVFKRGSSIPHSCEELCGKPNKYDSMKCPHLCSLMCHPGPCPPCEAIVTRNCHCQRTKIITKCCADERTLVCGDRCGKYFNCGLHQCENLCHSGECSPCGVEIEQKCCCDMKTVRLAICGSKEANEELFCCGNRCGRILACGNHQCESLCHKGDCISCLWTPDRISQCWCGKKAIDELEGCHRNSCLDSVPSCGLVCGRIIGDCQHSCARICHEGECGPCPLSRDVSCRCGKTVKIGVACASLSRDELVLCNKMCNKKLSCGRHRCSERCCSSELHWCFYPCGKTLTCKLHQCEQECGHVGMCPSCPNVSFDELHCECGAETILPPIACGQSPPICNKICTRDHACSHPVRHNCHSQSTCPPCTKLMSKSCPGDHRILDNIPCFRPVVTCGLECSKSIVGCDHLCIKICHQGDCVVDSSKCIQPCGKILDCGHPCTIPCHENECQLFSINCIISIPVVCMCGLRSSEFNCSTVRSFKSNSDLITLNDLYFCDKTAKFYFNCNQNCKHAEFMSNKIQAVSLSSSYCIIQKYYSTYFEEFCKNNFNFVMSVEKIFSNLSQQSSLSENFHKFFCISIDKAKFISRLSTTYKLISKVVYNFDANTANITIEAVMNKSIIPKSKLSKTVEDKYFKIFKPSF